MVKTIDVLIPGVVLKGLCRCNRKKVAFFIVKKCSLYQDALIIQKITGQSRIGWGNNENYFRKGSTNTDLYDTLDTYHDLDQEFKEYRYEIIYSPRWK